MGELQTLESRKPCAYHHQMDRRTLQKIIVLVGLICLTPWLVLLPACASSTVSTRSYEYSVDYIHNGRSYRIAAPYECFLDMPVWNEGGPNWTIRTGSPLHLNGDLGNGKSFTLEPRSGAVSDDIQLVCGDKDAIVGSEMFIATPNSMTALRSFDESRITMNHDKVQITSSKIRYLGTGNAPHSGRFERNLSPLYYTISMSVIDGGQIDALNLRDYINSRSSIWLRSGQTVTFHFWNKEDVAAARRFESTVPVLSRPDGGIGLTADYVGGVWDFHSIGSQSAIPWLQQDEDAYDKDKGLVIPTDNSLALSSIKFRQFTFNLPTRKYSTFHYYDPKTDEIYVFYILQRRVALQK